MVGDANVNVVSIWMVFKATRQDGACRKDEAQGLSPSLGQAAEEGPAAGTEGERPVKRKTSRVLKVSRRKGPRRRKGSVVSCGMRGTFTATAPRALGVVLPATPGDGFRPNERAAPMCLMGTALTRTNQKDVGDVFPRE